MKHFAKAIVLCVAPFIGAGAAVGQEHVTFPTPDGGLISADLYGSGSEGVVLAHGGRFDKESWTDQARMLSDAGFLVLALDFRGYGASRGPGQSDPLAAPLYFDVLGAVQYLRTYGVNSVSVLGGSMGGSAAADAAVESGPEEIDRLILLGSGAGRWPERIRTRTLFVTARDDTAANGTPRLIGIREDYERVPAPKELLVLDGSSHAQYMFETEQAERLMQEILRFLSAP